MFWGILAVKFPFFLPLGFIGLYRWLWFCIKCTAYLLYKPIKPTAESKYKSHNATILVPTIDSGEEIKLAIKSWLKSDPFEIIFITTPSAEAALWELAHSVDPHGLKVRVITVAKPNKRNQMIAGINQVKTSITIFADDDVLWPPNMVNWLCAPFDDDKMGGVGSSQKVLPINKNFTIWEILAAFRISMRNIEITASTYIDGGVTCLSGRTAAYRTSILRDPDFQWKFTNEYWRGKYHLHSGDDKFLTRWMQQNKHKTHIQTCKDSELLSTFKDNWTFLKQLVRWTRNSWRSDIKALVFERQIWKSHPFTSFTMLDKVFNPITLFFGPAAFAYILVHDKSTPYWIYFVSYFIYLILTRLLKYIPHFFWRPIDVFSIPALIVFNYYFGFMKLYCLFTLHVTNWGTRVGADNQKANAEGNDISEIYRVHHEIIDEKDSAAAKPIQNPADRHASIDVENETPREQDGHLSTGDADLRSYEMESPSSSRSSIQIFSLEPPLIHSTQEHAQSLDIPMTVSESSEKGSVNDSGIMLSFGKGD